MVMAPVSVEDCFWATVDAFNYAERFQVPVIVLTDQGLATRLEVITPAPTSRRSSGGRYDRRPASRPSEYRRYELTDGRHLADGRARARTAASTSRRASPTTSYGHPAYTPDIVVPMQQQALGEAGAAQRTASSGTPTTAKSNRRSRSSASARRSGRSGGRSICCAAEGLSIGAFYPRVLGPFPVDAVQDFTAVRERVVVPEVNFTGQLARLIRAEVGIQVESHAKCGRPPVHRGGHPRHRRPRGPHSEHRRSQTIAEGLQVRPQADLVPGLRRLRRPRVAVPRVRGTRAGPGDRP